MSGGRATGAFEFFRSELGQISVGIQENFAKRFRKSDILGIIMVNIFWDVFGVMEFPANFREELKETAQNSMNTVYGE